jgi:hypothetical protein
MRLDKMRYYPHQAQCDVVNVVHGFTLQVGNHQAQCDVVNVVHGLTLQVGKLHEIS